jgi:hypothetical protein
VKNAILEQLGGMVGTLVTSGRFAGVGEVVAAGVTVDASPEIRVSFEVQAESGRVTVPAAETFKFVPRRGG